ncbi:MAG: FHA domain-containing protein, partial [Gemmataceae bacterium]
MNKRDLDHARAPALVPLFGGHDKKPRTLERDVMSVGRARGCDVILEAPDVSTLHCLVYRTPEGFRIRDCG